MARTGNIMRKPSNGIYAYVRHVPQYLKIHQAQTDGFSRTKIYPGIPADRILGVDLASHMVGKELQTAYVATSSYDSSVMQDTIGEPVPFAVQLDYLSTLTDSEGKPFMEHDKPSWTRQRPARKRTDTDQKSYAKYEQF